MGGKLLECQGVIIDAPTGSGGGGGGGGEGGGDVASRRVVDGFTYEFLRKDRIGIVGPNGAGKSA